MFLHILDYKGEIPWCYVRLVRIAQSKTAEGRKTYLDLLRVQVRMDMADREGDGVLEISEPDDQFWECYEAESQARQSASTATYQHDDVPFL
jgi:hypothetical protein